jgi:hypothetical protein
VDECAGLADTQPEVESDGVPAREREAEAVPRNPSAAAPPVALGLPVPHPLYDIEGVGEVEGDPEVVKLALGE